MIRCVLYSAFVMPASELFDHLVVDASRQQFRLDHDSLHAACRDTRLECYLALSEHDPRMGKAPPFLLVLPAIVRAFLFTYVMPGTDHFAHLAL